MIDINSFRFNQVDDSVKDKLLQILKKLPITSTLNNFVSEYKLNKNKSITLTFNELFDFVIKNIIEDFENNEIEFENENIKFDYLVANVTEFESVLQILTCLRSMSGDIEGEVQYGMTILRESADKYLLWKE